MKLLQIIPYMDSKYGGPVYVAKSLLKYFKKVNIKSSILTLGNKFENSEEIIFFKKSSERWFFSFDFMLNSVKYIKQNDVLLIHGIYTFISLWSIFLALIFKKRVILRPAGMLDKNSIFSSYLLKNIIRYLYINSIGLLIIFKAEKIIFNSLKEKNNSLYGNLSKSILIPNGVDLEHINNVKCHKNKFNNQKVNIFFLGRINHIKGIELLIDSINNLDKNIKNKIILIIAGTGDKKYLEYIQNKSDTNIVKFIGHIEGDEKYCYLKQCDMYIQPSFTEGLSLAMLEAMACKVNMITTNRVGLFEELIERKAAKVVDYDEEQLKLAILNMLNKKKDYGTNGYKMIEEKYNWNMIIEQYKKLLGEK